jgi:type I restriction enzyme S subunit
MAAVYPSYRHSGIDWLGKIPAHWKIGRLKFSASARTSNVDKHTKDDEVPVQLCNYVDVYKNEFITPELTFMQASATPAEVERFSIRKGDVLITKDSESWDDIAVPAMVAEDLDGVLCGYHLAIIRSLPGEFHAGYLFRLFCSEMLNYQFKIEANGVTRFGLPTSAVDSAVLLRPPIEEQELISDYIDRETARIDALIERKRRLLELLEEKRLAVITAAVTKGLDASAPMRDSGVDWLGQIPAHWKVMTFNRACSIVGGQVDPKLEPYCDMRLIAPDHIESGTGRLLETETAAEQAAISGKYLFQRGDILYSKIRPELRKMCIAEGDGLCSADMYAIRHTSRLQTRYLFYLLLSKYHHQYAVLESMRVAMPKVNRETLSAFKILVPPGNEQREIMAFVEKHTTKIERMRERQAEAVELLQEYRSALITNAVTGKIDVRGTAEKEAAA